MKIRTLWVFLMAMAFATTAHGKLVTKSVPYQQNGVQMEGYLAYDDALKGKLPAVLVVHEWWGLNDYARKRAEQLAGLGYVAFALDMYGKGKVTQHPKQAAEWMREVNQNIKLWQQRALAGLEVLKKEPTVDAERMAAIGYCFGGSTVQVLAYSGAPLRGVVSFHGSLVLPPEGAESRVKAKILICHGAADPFVKMTQLDAYISAMNNSGLDWQMIIYGGAKHSFTNPEADKAGMEALKYDRSADLRSWAQMKLFFDEVLFGK